MMNQDQTVEAIRLQAAKDDVLNAVCHIFALRERARQQITMSTLRLTTAREGYQFTREQHARVLKFLADIGIGKLELRKGQVVALKGINVTLQSIGLAGVSKTEKLEGFVPSTKFKKLPTPKAAKTKAVASTPRPAAVSLQKEVVPDARPVQPDAKRYEATITIHIDNEPVTYPIPKGVTPAEIGALLTHLF